jgi:hypothetical protein
MIEINGPIYIVMDVLETEDRLPSMKMDLKCKVRHPTGDLSYHANDIWFSCGEWDAFEMAFGKIINRNKGEAILQDLSELFIFKINIEEKVCKITFSCKEWIIPDSSVVLSGHLNVDKSELDAIKDSFSNFPKWW